MTLIIPEGVPTLGATSTRFVSELSSLTTPSLAEVTDDAPASLDISFFLLAENWTPGQDTGRGTAPRRLGQRKQFERFNTTTQTLGDLRYVIDPQGAANSDGKKAYSTLVEGLNGYFVERLGKDARNDPFAVGDWVNIIPVTLGPQLIVGDTDENGDFTVMQPVSIRAERVDNVQLVA